MAKFYGVIGYAIQQQTSPGVWEEVITEKNYSGDVVKNTKRWQAGENLNDNLSVNNQISIVSDPFAEQNFFSMRYVFWMGTRWKVSNVEVLRPRLLLTIVGVYNE